MSRSSLVRCACSRLAAVEQQVATFATSVDKPSKKATTEPALSDILTCRSSNAKNDLRSTSGLGLGDGKLSHTSKWKSAPGPSPMELIARVPSKLVHTPVVLCYGHPDPDLGHEAEYIKVLGHDAEDPAVCKFCGLRYHMEGHH